MQDLALLQGEFNFKTLSYHELVSKLSFREM